MDRQCRLVPKREETGVQEELYSGREARRLSTNDINLEACFMLTSTDARDYNFSFNQAVDEFKVKGTVNPTT